MYAFIILNHRGPYRSKYTAGKPSVLKYAQSYITVNKQSMHAKSAPVPSLRELPIASTFKTCHSSVSLQRKERDTPTLEFFSHLDPDYFLVINC